MRTIVATAQVLSNHTSFWHSNSFIVVPLARVEKGKRKEKNYLGGCVKTHLWSVVYRIFVCITHTKNWRITKLNLECGQCAKFASKCSFTTMCSVPWCMRQRQPSLHFFPSFTPASLLSKAQIKSLYCSVLYPSHPIFISSIQGKMLPYGAGEGEITFTSLAQVREELLTT